jgi:phage shock protein B
MSGAMFVLGVVFLTIVAPLWIVLHYISRWRGQKVMSATDQASLTSLYEAIRRMEDRVNSLETVLRDHHSSGS